MLEFGPNLASLRRSRELTQSQLAELLPVQPRLVSRWETGESKPKFDHVVQLAEVLEVSLDELVRGDASEKDRRFDIRNKRLADLCRQVDGLAKPDQDVVCRLLDMVVQKDRLEARTRDTERVDSPAKR